MTVFVVIVAVVAVLALLALVHRWLWVRLVRDTTRAGGAARRAGTVLAFALPLLALAALTAGRAGAPFWLERLVAWPGYMWLAVLLYLTMAMAVAEPIRRLWLRRLPTASPAPQSPEGLDLVPAASGAEPPAPEGAGRGTAPQGPGTADQPTDAAAAAGTAGDAVPTGSGTAAAGVAGPDTAELPAGVGRRVFVARVLGGAAAVAAAGVVGNGTYGVLRGPRVKRVQVPLARLPRAAHGFRIAVVSDVHLGPVLGRAHTRRIVDTVNRTQPDLIAIVGDLVDGDVRDLGPAAEPLRELRARLGSFFVTGNHEYFSGAQQWVDHVRELGLTPLENARRELPHFDLAGVNDVQGEKEGKGPDFQAALGDRDRARASVLLAHQPIVIDEAVRHGVDLQLSGHTHGGQLWPGKYLAELANPTVAGLERYGDTQLYVSRGAGAWGPPVRVGAPSDITVVELASYQA
ncbi:metallophosphoesterase [Streptomyces sp. WAC07149]|uniref:metallophosphoesterase n=1 Tax=Streptomyces sp. WAC07149 TaxID=2487425 RepID=UPI000F772E4C|nr:metallophosphoesterase [Streptomyces sp. WAC07149]RSS99716.1 metallophosphoesterase [Streptomyces sp. WAC07149]